ncbi:hypothetical protein KAU34_02455 [candidate division WOR-3 bacterium]|nr:hypothetical protein [candidate division WOR-3 bacterium]
MKEKYIDTLNFVLGLIKSDAYLSFYFKSMCTRMHFKDDAYADALKAFNDFRKEVKEEKIKNKNDKKVTGCIISVDFEPEKTVRNKKKK